MRVPGGSKHPATATRTAIQCVGAKAGTLVVLTRVDEADDAVVDLGAKRGRGVRSSGFKKPCGRVSGDFARGADGSQLWSANDLINSGARRDARRGTETATSTIAAPTPRRATGTDITICSAATEVRSDVILFTIASALAVDLGQSADGSTTTILQPDTGGVREP